MLKYFFLNFLKLLFIKFHPLILSICKSKQVNNLSCTPNGTRLELTSLLSLSSDSVLQYGIETL